eukprot:SAG31_NODE_887_length_11220_cov_9.210233_5_plen_167_part_00
MLDRHGLLSRLVHDTIACPPLYVCPPTYIRAPISGRMMQCQAMMDSNVARSQVVRHDVIFAAPCLDVWHGRQVLAILFVWIEANGTVLLTPPVRAFQVFYRSCFCADMIKRHPHSHDCTNDWPVRDVMVPQRFSGRAYVGQSAPSSESFALRCSDRQWHSSTDQAP